MRFADEKLQIMRTAPHPTDALAAVELLNELGQGGEMPGGTFGRHALMDECASVIRKALHA